MKLSFEKQQYKSLLLLLLTFVVTALVLLIINDLKNKKAQVVNPITSPDSLLIYEQIQTDSLFGSSQMINVLRINKMDARYFQFDLAHHATELKLTSQFAKNAHALAAINGGFFNMDNGGSVTYLEENDTVFQKNIPHGEKWAVADWAKTGAIVIDKKGQLKLAIAESETFYETSKAESGVLITGPTLILKGKKIVFTKGDFFS